MQKEKKRLIGNKQTLIEEIINSISHGIGVALSIAALVVLLAKGIGAYEEVSFSVYGASLFILYLASTLYHAFPSGSVKRFFRIMDHITIFILIAGTYTPVALITLHGVCGWIIFGIIWGLAFLGILYKSIFTNRLTLPLEIFGVFLYIAMGWLALIAIKPLFQYAQRDFLIWLFVGGFFYTGGIVFYAWDKLKFNHTIWHLFVLAGSLSHFIGLYFYVLPKK